MFQKVRKFEIRGRIFAFVTTEHFEIFYAVKILKMLKKILINVKQIKFDKTTTFYKDLFFL